jgi:Mpv17 / PMP22 family
VIPLRGAVRAGKYIHGVMFGRNNLLMTNCLISAAMGAAGDVIQQYYDILRHSRHTVSDVDGDVQSRVSEDKKRRDSEEKTIAYVPMRTLHMTCAGLTTGVVSHWWYIYLDKWLGRRRTLAMTLSKVLLDQIVFSPVNLAVYFSTLSIVERSGFKRFKEELIEKGMSHIYLVEWFIWPPAQFFNFYCLPLRYRILFDNVISFGFDIYCPYVKYKTQLKSEKNNSEFNKNSNSESQSESERNHF